MNLALLQKICHRFRFYRFLEIRSTSFNVLHVASANTFNKTQGAGVTIIARLPIILRTKEFHPVCFLKMKTRNKNFPNRFRQYVIVISFAPLIDEFFLFYS